MTQDTIGSLTSQMRETLDRYVAVIRQWTTPDGKLPDPYESIYTENYAPANAAVILAAVGANGRTDEVTRLLDTMIGRTVELLGNKAGVTPFCRVFLYHYGLMALLLAPEADRDALLQRHGSFFSGYEDDCPIVNTNCAALQWAMELFTEALGLRAADERRLERRLAFIAAAQLSSGFINDEVDERQSHDGMPIAYHAFTLFLLVGALAAVDRWPERLSAFRDEARRIVDRGLSWLRRAVAPDGSLAMAERSGYQMFTWGALVALLSYAARNGEDVALAADAYRQWLPYEHEDGTYGCTPNHLPHSLRVGYETYTHLNMYNLLGLTGIAVALRLLERGERLREDERLDAPWMATAGDDAFVDTDSGYAFYRSGGGFFGCTLRMHNRRYTPAMQGFHFRMQGERPPLAEPRLPDRSVPPERSIREGIWEGYWVTDESGTDHFPNFIDNAVCSPIPGGLVLLAGNDGIRCEKTVTVSSDRIVWQYALVAKRPVASCRHAVPLLVHDGRSPLRVESLGASRLRLEFAGRAYELACCEAESLDLELHRSLLSPSGVAAKVLAVLPAPAEPGRAIRWTTVLRKL
jgi:hypothetical protein